nr:ion transport peptide-like [Dermatophagoides farinae]
MKMIKTTMFINLIVVLQAICFVLTQSSIIPLNDDPNSSRGGGVGNNNNNIVTMDMNQSRPKKSSFSSIGCLGTYDRAKFARLDRVCDECYQLYRDQELHRSCREFCFKNEVFPACVDALMLSHEEKELSDIVNEMLG